MKRNKKVIDAYEVELLASGVRHQVLDRIKSLQLKRKDLAQLLGVTEGRVSQIISGPEHLNLNSLVAIGTALSARWELLLWPAEHLSRRRDWDDEGPVAPIKSERVPLPHEAPFTASTLAQNGRRVIPPVGAGFLD